MKNNEENFFKELPFFKQMDIDQLINEIQKYTPFFDPSRDEGFCTSAVTSALMLEFRKKLNNLPKPILIQILKHMMILKELMTDEENEK